MSFYRHDYPHSSNYDSDLREVLCKLQNVLNDYDDLITEIGDIGADVEDIKTLVDSLKAQVEAFDEVIDDAIASMQAEIEEELDKAKEELDAKLAEFMLSIAKQLSNINTLIDNKINAYDITLQEQIKAQYTELMTLILALQRQIDETMPTTMTNPLTHKVDTIPNVVTNLYKEASKEHALYNFEYESLGLSNDEYVHKGLTDKEFDLWGRDYIHKFYWFNSLHPADGFMTSEYNVNSYILNELIGVLTAEQYVAEDLTNDEYAEIGLTDKDYLYWKAIPPSVDLTGFVRTGGNGITDNQYSQLEIVQ